MADPRLQWRPLQQQQANVAGLMRNSNLAFNEGIDSASGILDSYDKGRKAIGDKEAMHRLAGLNDETELDAFLANGGLSDLNVSDEMLANLGKARGDVLGYANDRSIVTDRDARTGIAQGDFGLRQNADRRAGDVHGVMMEDERWRQGRRGEMAGLSGDIVGARVEGQDFGQNGAPQSDVQAQVYQGMLDRGFPEHIAQGFMMNFQDESGFNIGVTEAEPNVHGTRGKGLYQLTGPRREAFEAKYGNDYSIDNQLDFLVEELGTTEAGARDVIFNSQNAGEAGANIVNNFLRPASEHARDRSAKYTGANGYTLPPDTARGTPARDRLETRLAQSEFLSPTDITGLLDTNDAFVAQGTSAADEERRKLQQDMIAQLTMDAVGNAENTTPAEVQAEVQERLEASGEFSSSEILNGQKAAEEIIAGSAGIQTQLNPSVSEDVRFGNLIDGANDDINAALEATPQGRMMRDTQQFQSNPTEGLVEALGIGSDGENPGGLGGLLGAESGFDKNDLTNLINQYAADNDVAPAVAAAAMREAFKRDPTGRNTLARRFPATEVAELIKGNLGQEDVSRFQDDTRLRAEFDQRLQTMNDEVRQLQVQAEKDPSRAPAARQRIAELYAKMSQVRRQAQDLYRGGDDITAVPQR